MENRSLKTRCLSLEHKCADLEAKLACSDAKIASLDARLRALEAPNVALNDLAQLSYSEIESLWERAVWLEDESSIEFTRVDARIDKIERWILRAVAKLASLNADSDSAAWKDTGIMNVPRARMKPFREQPLRVSISRANDPHASRPRPGRPCIVEALNSGDGVLNSGGLAPCSTQRNATDARSKG